MERIDKASRIIRASPQVIYRALLDPAAMIVWRPPEGMHGVMYEFDPRVEGIFRMALVYNNTDHALQGKTSGDTDVATVRFVELMEDERVVEAAEFESDDPAFAGTMIITTTLVPVSGGTEVTIACSNVPSGIRPEDHYQGISSTLKNLAAFTEK